MLAFCKFDGKFYFSTHRHFTWSFDDVGTQTEFLLFYSSIDERNKLKYEVLYAVVSILFENFRFYFIIIANKLFIDKFEDI